MPGSRSSQSAAGHPGFNVSSVELEQQLIANKSKGILIEQVYGLDKVDDVTMKNYLHEITALVLRHFSGVKILKIDSKHFSAVSRGRFFCLRVIAVVACFAVATLPPEIERVSRSDSKRWG